MINELSYFADKYVLIDMWDNQDIKICGGVSRLLDEKDIARLRKSNQWHFDKISSSAQSDFDLGDSNSDSDSDADLFVNTNRRGPSAESALSESDGDE